MKKIILRIIIFLVGVGIAFLTESFFRGFIQDVFQISTSDKIQFIGKNIYFIPNIIFLPILGLSIVTLSIENSNKNNFQIFINILRSLLLFFISIILISAVDAKLKVIECTACIDGIRKLNWNDINYGIILGSSILISIIPSLIKIKKTNSKKRNLIF
ncbi:hypothetical protein [Flavobacterium cucumis]|uniref:Uncharacterized protein n=1 Tax=Flavobacterium cucumis TaxID=416016 RepID=A0A1M7ZVW3_9FLAO|nr:hypothetical protein [Flavobacterium cucumis]SHO73008.1 hypothetical protein SAMN05443547_1358 [Flavobacterium cucumis]